MNHVRGALRLAASLCMLLALAQDTLALRITSIDVPVAVANASAATLTCMYDLHGEQLYSVSWYKNYVEFYRFEPNRAAAAASDAGSKQDYKLEGIQVNLTKSNATHVHLSRVTLASAGTFKCEVSAEPSFATVALERDMRVYVLPRQKLTITDNALAAAGATEMSVASSPAPLRTQTAHSGAQNKFYYNINELVNLTCAASRASPPMQLSWLVNGAPAPSKWVSNEADADARSTLAFRLQPAHLLGNTMSGEHDGNVSFAEKIPYNERPYTKPSQRARPVRVSCAATMHVEFVRSTSLPLTSASGSRSRNQLRRSHTVLPEPAALAKSRSSASLTTRGSGDEYSHNDTATTSAAAYKWPAQHEQRHLSSVQPGSLGSLYESGWPPTTGRNMIWTNAQLRAQAQHIEYVTRLAKSNQLEAPVIEAHHARDSPDASSAEDSEQPEPSDNSEFSARENRARRDFELDDEVAFECHARAPNRNPALGARIELEWYINEQLIEAERVNEFNGSAYNYVASSQDSTLQRKHESKGHQEQSGSSGDSSISLVVQFSRSMFLAKEMKLKCLLRLKQPLIQFDAEALITNSAMIAAGSQASGSIGTGNQRNRSKHRNGYTMRPVHTANNAAPDVPKGAKLIMSLLYIILPMQLLVLLLPLL